MNVVEAIVVFVMIWWVVLFMTLPVGIRRDRSPKAGNDPGAPVEPAMWRKMAVTTAISLVLFGLVYWVVESDLFASGG